MSYTTCDNTSKTNDEYVKEYGGSLGDKIEYEKENWPDLIDSTRTLLIGLASKLWDVEADE